VNAAAPSFFFNPASGFLNAEIFNAGNYIVAADAIKGLYFQTISSTFWQARNASNSTVLQVGVAGVYASVISGGRVVYTSSVDSLGTLSSTRRVKNNITPYTFNENAILSVIPYKFKYNIDGDAGVWQYGFMAEDINDAGLPEMCGFDKDGLPDYVAYERFCIAQQQIIRKLWSKVDDLTAKVEYLTSKIETPTTK
jgi:hypothetical protein